LNRAGYLETEVHFKTGANPEGRPIRFIPAKCGAKSEVVIAFLGKCMFFFIFGTFLLKGSNHFGSPEKKQPVAFIKPLNPDYFEIKNLFAAYYFCLIILYFFFSEK